jgi:hypothetical protein
MDRVRGGQIELINNWRAEAGFDYIAEKAGIMPFRRPKRFRV